MRLRDIKKEYAGLIGGNTGSRVSNIGTTKFRLSLDKEDVKTPHYRMDKVLQMIEDRPNVSAGLNQIVKFLISDVKITSSDTKTQDFLNDWLEKRPMFGDELEAFVTLWAGCGTSYFEPSWIKEKGSKKVVLDNIFTVADPSIIYKNLFAQSDDEYWLVQVPLDVRMYDDRKPEYVPITYIRGSYLRRTFIWAVKYPKSKFIQGTLGWSRDNIYGTGLLSSAVDNIDIEQEILKNWALIAKYRAMGKKIIGFYSENNESIDMTELDRIKEEFMGMEEEDSLIINRKFVSEDLTFNGQDNQMDSQIEYLRKDTGSSLTPNYMTAFSQDSAMATAAEAKVPFSLQLKSLQNKLILFLNDCIIDTLRDRYDFIAEDATFDLGKPELYSRDEMFNWVSMLYNNRAATFNEYREAAGLPKVEGGDVWGEAPPLDKVNTQTRAPQLTMQKASKPLVKVKEHVRAEFVTKAISPDATKKQKNIKLKEAVSSMLR